MLWNDTLKADKIRLRKKNNFDVSISAAVIAIYIRDIHDNFGS